MILVMSRFPTDAIFIWTLRSAGALAALLVALIVVFLIVDSAPALQALGGRMFTDSSWYPDTRASEGSFGLMPMIWGTLAVTIGSVLLAAPAAVASAVFCRFYAPPGIASVYRRLIELLAGIPSVVYGFWGLVVLAPLIARLHPPGPSLLAGILILALMILPTIALIADASIGAVARSHIEGAAALGMGRWTIVRSIALPEAAPGIITGVILGAARAIGETMAVLMVCGNIVKTPDSLFDPVRTLTANIALEMGYALGDHRSALFASGLLLMAVVIVLIALAEIAARGRRIAGLHA